MKTISRRASSILLLVSAVLLTGCRSAPSPFDCTDAIGCVDIPAGTPIDLGVLQVLSGDLAPFGESALRSIELAKDDRDGQILGHPIVLRAEDSLCSKEGGATAASKITADPQVVAILGPTCSGADETAIKVVSEAGFVMISGSCSWYDAAGMLFDAIQAVAVRDTAGGFHVGRQALRDALHATSSYHGLTGTLTCDQRGDCGVARFEILRPDDPSYGLEGLASNVVYTYPPGN